MACKGMAEATNFIKTGLLDCERGSTLQLEILF
jgi:hypothetical protein